MHLFGIFMHLLCPPPILIINVLAFLDILHSYATLCLYTKIFQENLAADKIVLGKNSYLVRVNDQEYATQ